MKKSLVLLVAATIIALSSCKKEYIAPTPVPTAKKAEIKFLTSSLIPTSMGTDSMVNVLLRIRISVTAGDSDIYFPQLIPADYKQVLDVNLRGNTSIYSLDADIYTETDITATSSGNYIIPAGETGIMSYVVRIHTHANRGEYRLQLYRFLYSSGQDDGIYESSVEYGPEFVTEWIPTI